MGMCCIRMPQYPIHNTTNQRQGAILPHTNEAQEVKGKQQSTFDEIEQNKDGIKSQMNRDIIKIQPKQTSSSSNLGKIKRNYVRKIQTNEQNQSQQLALSNKSYMTQNTINSLYIQSKMDRIIKQLEETSTFNKKDINKMIPQFIKRIQNKYRSKQKQLDIAYLQSLLMNNMIIEGKDIGLIEEHYKKALNIYQKYQSKYFQEILTLHNNMAQCLLPHDKSRALNIYRKGLAMLQKYVNVHDERKLMAYNNIGCALCQMGRYQEGLSYLGKYQQFKGEANDQFIKNAQKNKQFFQKQEKDKFDPPMINLLFKSHLLSIYVDEEMDNVQEISLDKSVDFSMQKHENNRKKRRIGKHRKRNKDNVSNNEQFAIMNEFQFQAFELSENLNVIYNEIDRDI